MAFLACGGNNSDSSKSVEQLENLLRSTTTQNKVGVNELFRKTSVQLIYNLLGITEKNRRTRKENSVVILFCSASVGRLAKMDASDASSETVTLLDVLSPIKR